MASPTMTDKQLAEKYGQRLAGAVSIFAPYEWGYRCPKGHRGELITWSEFKEHIWCYKCQLDYPSETCLMQRPSWMEPAEFKAFVARLPFKPKIVPGVNHYLEAASHPLKEIRVWGKIAILRRARKEHKCAASGLPIERGEEHYCVYICGAGLGGTKFPDRVRIENINDYLNFGGKR